ncbi:Uncharacterized protein BM_BM13058 [Brugia malayi]|uniref:Bm13058 n=1 Tax=Brugia malayi TaxID=6279 RepID=A0A0K0IWQ9_BRUMA|nr:Uncharacterized protein BM_BM13058 [Brugia malayi]CDP93722.1 Bm13058 [Brugia malayi]VIP00008.1 Uncharacterized protein BM_BM13058 [Brugia malayi]
MPNTSKTDPIDPPAIMPVPALAALKTISPEQNLALISWCKVLPSRKYTLITDFFAAFTAFILL